MTRYVPPAIQSALQAAATKKTTSSPLVSPPNKKKQRKNVDKDKSKGITDPNPIEGVEHMG